MRVLEYQGLEIGKLASSYKKVAQALMAGDFRAAQVKKLSDAGNLKLYRAKLDERNRLVFALVRHQGETCVLMLEIILNHNYDRSRFLRGASIDDDKLPDFSLDKAHEEAEALRFLHPHSPRILFLDKPISLDETQTSVFEHHLPLIIAGGAGSGKTALMLERLKLVEGRVLYVTQSAYLAQSARDLYFAHGFQHAQQEVQFLSYRSLLESMQLPLGREAQWRDFLAWFGRVQQSFKGIAAHQAFEEIRGVITAAVEGPLTLEAYLALGIKQSIFSESARAQVYQLYEKYVEWLKIENRFDLNEVSYRWLALAKPTQDFVVVDEVQDFTPVQLQLILRCLSQPSQFLLCGDANQIVHPNFFAWSQVKTMFWRKPDAHHLSDAHHLKVLSANYRNGQETTRVANQLLKIKQHRFGSIDRETNDLVKSVGANLGSVQLLSDGNQANLALNDKIRRSTKVAVLVMRDEEKAEARKYFSTPLLFSIHEAKGLEYENIVLFRFVSNHRQEFAEVCENISTSDLAQETLEYRRSKDKSDKSLEIYKFFVNALYVGITRAITHVYVVETDLGHPMLGLLGLKDSPSNALNLVQSSIEEWQKEARKLELQGKQEQAEAIRNTILKTAPVPWNVLDESASRHLLNKVLRDSEPGSKYRQQLMDIAAYFNAPQLAMTLEEVCDYRLPQEFSYAQPVLSRKSFLPYFSKGFKDILKQCEKHGIEHRLPMNQTPLMAAAAAGNVALVAALLERGADKEACDHLGRNALHLAMREAFVDAKFAASGFAEIYDWLAPSFIDLEVDGRLVRIDQALSEYFVFQSFWALNGQSFMDPMRSFSGGLDARRLIEAWQHLPARVLRSDRNKRAHLSNVLSRNEIGRDYAYNRALFLRVERGQYQFNPQLRIRRLQAGQEHWDAIYHVLNLSFVYELASVYTIPELARLMEEAKLPPPPASFARELYLKHIRLEREKYEAEDRRQREESQRVRARIANLQAENALKRIAAKEQREEQAQQARQTAEKQAAEKRAAESTQRVEEPPKWGTPGAKRAEIERVRKLMEEGQRQREREGKA